jgi:hypothetical protein
MGPTGREVGWYRHERAMAMGPALGLGVVDAGHELVTALPTYDNGAYYVIDTVKDLVWQVMSWETGRPMREVRLDKYEAIRVADDLHESDARSRP